MFVPMGVWSRRNRCSVHSRGGGVLALSLLLLVLLQHAAVPARGQAPDGVVIAQADLQGLQGIGRAHV